MNAVKGIEEGHPKCVQVRTGEGGWKIGNKIRKYKVDGPKQMFFCVLVWPSTVEH